MMDLSSKLNVAQLSDVLQYTDMRLDRPSKYVCAEAIALYEQNVLPEAEIHKLCEDTVHRKLYNPAATIVPQEYVKHFKETSKMVPIAYNAFKKQLTVVALTELDTNYEPLPGVKVFIFYVPIYIYFKRYVETYGAHEDLLKPPADTIFKMIIREATDMRAADITLSTNGLKGKSL